MKKRGISPLIGTVLLIGFTIGLALVVFTWGGDLISNLTEDNSGVGQLTCFNEVDIELSNGCKNGADVTFTVENKKDTVVSRYIIRVYDESGNPYIETTTSELEAFGVNRKTITTDLTGIINKVELLRPSVVKDGESLECPDIKREISIDNDCPQTS